MNTNETIYRVFIRVIQKLGLDIPCINRFYERIRAYECDEILDEIEKRVDSIRCAQKKQDKAEVLREVAKLWLCTLVLLVSCSPPSDGCRERVRRMLCSLPEPKSEESIRVELVRLVNQNLNGNHENEAVDLLWLLSLLLLVSFGLDKDILMHLIMQWAIESDRNSAEVARNERGR